jgi:hypothetical protein
LAAYEQRLIERDRRVDDGPPIYAVCEECRRTSSFPGSRQGWVEICPNCGAFLDVGDEPGMDGWDATPEEEP